MPARKTAAAIALAAALLGGTAGCGSSGSDGAGPATTTADAPVEASSLPPEEFAAYLEANPDVPLVNVHIPYEGHLEGTDAFVPFEKVASWDGLPEDRDDPVALYCRSGSMSRTAMETLEGIGYTNVVDLAGGMQAWTAAGYDLLDQEP